ncbi:MAG: ribosome silencing factor [Bryobacterales bacterium]|nr:ribosome silencing factor [Bryobacterales bacterium]
MSGAAPTLEATVSPTWQIAARAADSKKATDVRILDLREVTTFADHFVICTGSSSRQTRAIWDEIVLQIKQQAGERAINVEGYDNGEWVLGDFGDLVIHVFTDEKREYYQLERLWRDAKDVPLPDLAA